MNIRQLEAFRAIMVARSTIGAAELLIYLQPAVSRLLSQLEASLKLTLFDRSSGRLGSDAGGTAALRRSRAHLHLGRQIREMARDIRSADAGSLNIGSSPSAGARLLPGVIRQFNVIHPRIRITLHVQMSAKVEEWAAAQQIDFGFAEFPYQPGPSIDRASRPRSSAACPIWLAVPRGHRLATRKIASVPPISPVSASSRSRPTRGRPAADRPVVRAGGCGARHGRRLSGHGGGRQSDIARVGVGFLDPLRPPTTPTATSMPLRFEPVVEMRIGMLHPTHRPLTRIAGSEFAGLLRSLQAQGRLRNFPAAAEVSITVCIGDPCLGI